MTQSSFAPFSSADLETNKAGRLADDQRKNLKSMAKSFRHNELVFGLICAVIAALVATATGPAPNAQYRPIAAAAFAVLAVVFVLRGTILGDSLTQDLRGGKVETIEGAVGKRTWHGKSTEAFYLEVGGRSFEVGGTMFHAAPDAGIVKLYFVPRSKHVVNMERLPDRPLPEGALSSPTAVLGVLKDGLFAHDSVQRNEARAEMEAIKDSFVAQQAAAATVPPPDQRDPRPLSEAILGTWQQGPVSMTFMPDGTVVATVGFRRQHGRWSIGADGKLHSDATGSEQTADAWVAGDTLSIAENGQALAFRRAQAADPAAGPAAAS